MTKLKSKKMTKSTFAIIIMAIAMVAMLAFGGTYAYFTATATTNSASIKTGYVGLIASTIDATNSDYELTVTNAFPGDVLIANPVTVTAETSDTKGVYVAVKFEVEGVTDIANLFKLDTTKWQLVSDNTYVYISAADTAAKLTDGQSATVLANVKLEETVTGEPTTQNGAEIVDGSLQNKTITIGIKSAAVQVSNFEDATLEQIVGAVSFAA